MRNGLSASLVSVVVLHTGVASAVTFTNVSAPSGLSAVGSKSSWWFDVKFEDFNNDGYQDLFWADHSMVSCAYLVNQHDGTFKDMSATAFPKGYGTSSVWNLQPVDFDNDGWVDLQLISGDTGGASFRNLGNGIFTSTQVQKSWEDANGHGSAVADIDGDGSLEILYNRNPSAVLRRSASGSYEDIAASLGLDVRTGFSSTFADFDGDGKPDLFTYFCSGLWCASGDRTPKLLVNDGRGGFLDRTGDSGLAGAPGVAALAAGDHDNDGDLDLYITGILETADTGTMIGRLYRNDSKGVFTDVTSPAGLPASFGNVTVYAQIPSRATWADLDNDGFLDLLVFGSARGTSHVYFFRNTGNGTFEDASAASGLGAILTRQPVAADYDNDGDLDVASVDTDRFLFRNETNNGDWLKVRLAGCSIKTAVGSRVWVYDHGHLGEPAYLRGYREVIQANSHETPLEQHFGVSATRTYDVRAQFYPEADATVVAQDISPGKALVLTCPTGTPPPHPDIPDASATVKADARPDILPSGVDSSPAQTADATLAQPGEPDVPPAPPQESGADAGTLPSPSSSGCGCMLGRGGTALAAVWPMLALGLLAFGRVGRAGRGLRTRGGLDHARVQARDRNPPVEQQAELKQRHVEPPAQLPLG